MLVVVAALGLTACAPKAELSPDRPEARAELRAFTGAKTRLVWVQDVEQQGDVFGGSSLKALIGFDSDETPGERSLLPKPGYYVKPLITPKGDRVVVSDFKARTAHIVNWDGTCARMIAEGMAIEVWVDPDSGVEWVFIQRGPEDGESFDKNPVYRHEIDHPERFELAWDKTPVSAVAAGSFQVSSDGRRAAGLFPWGDAGIANLETGDWERIGSGCWTAMSPDNSYRAWIFDGAHRNITFADESGLTSARINLSSVADGGRGEVYHPRWSNHPRFLTLTSPYFLKEGVVMAGSPEVEVVIGRFNESFTSVEAWVQVTHNRRGDYFPDLWIDRGAHVEPPHQPEQGTASGDGPAVAWPGDLAGLVFRWENAARKNEVFDPISGEEKLARLVLNDHARIGPHQEMELTGGNGSVVLDPFDPVLFEALRKGYGFTLEATITPASPTSEESPVISFSNAPEDRNFALVQRGETLAFEMKTEREGGPFQFRIDLGPVPMGRPVHVAVTYERSGVFAAYLDGIEVAKNEEIRGSLANWTPQPLVFGGRFPRGDSWSGTLDGIAIYDISLDAHKIRTHVELNASRMAGRVAPARSVVEAVLKEITATPPPAAIAPYRRCLVVHRYEVLNVLSGSVEGNDILVAHWGILDGRPLDSHQPEAGASYRLELERFDDHPQLVSERMDMSTTAFDLPLYYEPIPMPSADGIISKPPENAGDLGAAAGAESSR